MSIFFLSCSTQEKKTSIIHKKSAEKPAVDIVNKSIATPTTQYPKEEERMDMVETQLIPRGIENKRVLSVMRSVPRHLFIPRPQRYLAYEDQPVVIGLEQTISQPYIVAYMTEALDLQPHHTILEIGTGSGYQAAVLADLAREVYTIEIIPPLSKRAQTVLNEIGYSNIHFRIGDGYAGWAEVAPFDAIILTASPPAIPQPLLEQLKEGGVMIAPVGKNHQALVKITRTKSGYERKVVMGVRFVPMTGKAQEEK